MIVTTVRAVRCDFCRSEVSSLANTPDEVRAAAARTFYWVHEDGLDRCPQHQDLMGEQDS